MLTLGSCRSCLQNWTSFPRKSPFSCRNGSPPEKLIFSMPEKHSDEFNCMLFSIYVYCTQAQNPVTWILPEHFIFHAALHYISDKYRTFYLNLELRTLFSFKNNKLFSKCIDFYLLRWSLIFWAYMVLAVQQTHTQYICWSYRIWCIVVASTILYIKSKGNICSS